MQVHGPIYTYVENEMKSINKRYQDKLGYPYETLESVAISKLLPKIQELEQSKSYQIKPLEWTKVIIDYPGYNGLKDAYYWRAPGYMINLPNSRGWVICGVPLEKGGSNIYFKTEDEAKAICEKHYEDKVKLNLI